MFRELLLSYVLICAVLALGIWAAAMAVDNSVLSYKETLQAPEGYTITVTRTLDMESEAVCLERVKSLFPDGECDAH